MTDLDVVIVVKYQGVLGDDTSLSTDFIKHSNDIPKLRRDRNITMQ